MISWKKLLFSFGASFSAAAIGSVATFANIPTWYETLEKPAFTPPSWVFSPVWSVLYILIGLSLYWLWTSQIATGKAWAYGLYVGQLGLNALWSLVFFGGHWLELSVVVIGALWLCIAASIWVFYRISRLASYAFIPYLLWISFATYLTVAFARLN